jgi:hypothetical protein
MIIDKLLVASQYLLLAFFYARAGLPSLPRRQITVVRANLLIWQEPAPAARR